MGNRSSVALVGVALLCTSQALAGTSGNGWAQRNGTVPVAKMHYSYCIGGRPKTVYFSNVIVSAPTINRPDLNGPFGKYLTMTFGVGSNDGGQCFTSAAMADAVNGKKQREDMFVARTWKIVETEWAGVATH